MGKNPLKVPALDSRTRKLHEEGDLLVQEAHVVSMDAKDCCHGSCSTKSSLEAKVGTDLSSAYQKSYKNIYDGVGLIGFSGLGFGLLLSKIDSNNWWLIGVAAGFSGLVYGAHLVDKGTGHLYKSGKPDYTKKVE